jgi:hypothetical protein
MDREATKIPSSNFSRFRFASPLLGISHYARYQEAHTTPLDDSGLHWRLKLEPHYFYVRWLCPLACTPRLAYATWELWDALHPGSATAVSLK